MALIGITGATGGLGGRVARLLAERGAPMRLVVRDPSRAPEVAGAEVAVSVGGFGDAEAMRHAFDGVTDLLLVSATEHPDRVGLHVTAVEAAAAAGVERIVYTSFFGAAPDATFTFGRDHWHTEQAIEATGLRRTFLRDNFYLDYMPLLAGEDGVIRGPAGDGRLAAVARDDVADSAAAVLLDGSGAHDGRAYGMTGPVALTLAEVAEELTRTTGRPITYHEETVEEAYASRASYGAPAFEVDGWVSTYTAIAAGEVEAVTDAVERLSGHPATDLRGYLATHPERWAHLKR